MLQRHVEAARVDETAGEPDALVEAHEMGRVVDVDLLAGGFEEGAQVRDGRALAVGAGDMNDRGDAILWAAHALEQPDLAIEMQVDELGVERQEALENRVGAGHGGALLARPPGRR